MKPFNLEAAKRGEPICTKDGKRATFIAYIPECAEHMRVLVHIHERMYVNTYNESGLTFPEESRNDDLFMAPRKRTVWLNIYDDPFDDACMHPTQEAADASQRVNGTRIGGRAWPLEIEG